MDTNSAITMEKKSPVFNLAGWLFGVLFFAIGLVNTFWGNDPGFGIFILLLSLVYIPPVNAWIKEKTGFAIPLVAKIILALFLIWASLGVGELFDKINLMMMDF